MSDEQENWWDTEPNKPGLVIVYECTNENQYITKSVRVGAAVYIGEAWVLTGSSGLFDWDYVVSWLRFINADIRTLDGMILQRPGRIT